MKERSWAAVPFAPPCKKERANEPYICRLAPYDSKFEMEWFDNGSCGAHTLYYRLKDSEESYAAMPLTSRFVTVEGLQNDIDYEFYIARDDGTAKSETRLVQLTPPVDGATVVNYIHPDDQYYNFAGWWIGSPYIVKLSSGKLIAAHDVFGEENNVEILFSSEDDGKTWQYLTELAYFWTCKFFENNGKLYVMGSGLATCGIGIAESSDEGKTWSEPVTLIRKMHNKSQIYKGYGNIVNNTPIISHNGRLYTVFETGGWSRWNDDAYDCHMLSAPVDSNLLDMNSWEYTPGCNFDHSDFDIPDADFLTAIEGNAIVGPDGEIYSLSRMDAVYGPKKKGVRTELFNVALLYKLKSFHEPMEYIGPVSAKVGNRHMFCIHKDDVSNKYIMIHNEETPTTLGRRNILSLSVSDDILHWEKKATLLDVRNAPGESTVSQPSFVFSGDDLLFLSRTSWGRMFNQHNSNMLTFHRVKNFRDAVK